MKPKHVAPLSVTCVYSVMLQENKKDTAVYIQFELRPKTAVYTHPYTFTDCLFVTYCMFFTVLDYLDLYFQFLDIAA